MKTTLGTCSLCGGAVTVEKVTSLGVPPIPRCESCYSEPKFKQHGPLIEMEGPPVQCPGALPFRPDPFFVYGPGPVKPWEITCQNVGHA